MPLVRIQRALHPVLDVLRHAAQHPLRRMHMGIDQPRQHGAAVGVERLPGLKATDQLGRGTDGDDAALPHGHRAVTNIAYALTLHRQEMRVRY